MTCNNNNNNNKSRNSKINVENIRSTLTYDSEFDYVDEYLLSLFYSDKNSLEKKKTRLIEIVNSDNNSTNTQKITQIIDASQIEEIDYFLQAIKKQESKIKNKIIKNIILDSINLNEIKEVKKHLEETLK